VQQSRKQTGF